MYNGLVGFASPLVTDRDTECASPVSTQTSFAAGIFYTIGLLKVAVKTLQLNTTPSTWELTSCLLLTNKLWIQLFDALEWRRSQTPCPRMHARPFHETWEPPLIPHPARWWWTAKVSTRVPRELYETPKQDEVWPLSVFTGLYLGMFLSYHIQVQQLKKYL